MKAMTRFLNISRKIGKISVIRAIRDGLVSMIPVLIIGAFALVLKTFPIEGYQDFIASFWDGALLHFFNFVYTVTFGVLSVYMTFSISRSSPNSSRPWKKRNCSTKWAATNIRATYILQRFR